MKSIDLMIIGAQKAGTTSLNSYLSQHPELVTHEQTEMTFFLDGDAYSLGYEQAFRRYFPKYEDGKMLLAKNVGIMYSRQAMERIYQHNPHMKLVVVLRNPVDRAYSAYWFARRRGWEPLPTFEEALEADASRFLGDPIHARNCAYLERSRYAEHLEMIFSIFPRSQVHIFLTDDMKQDIRRVCAQIFASVGLDQNIALDTSREHNRASVARSESLARILGKKSLIKKVFRKILSDGPADRIKSRINSLNEQEIKIPPISPETARRLGEYFRPYNEKLAGLVGRDFSHWDKYA